MIKAFSLFEQIARGARNVSQSAVTESGGIHPFDERNIHPDIAGVSMKLFDDGHYAQATLRPLNILTIR